MLTQGLLATEWGVSENNRRARFYKLTPAGHRRLKQDVEAWDRLAEAQSRARSAWSALWPVLEADAQARQQTMLAKARSEAAARAL